MFINDWFIPSVKVAATSGSRAFAFGATIALRRHTLQSIGGFQAIANQLADDYRLGELTRAKGLRTVLSELEVDVIVNEADFRALVRHELRWLRTIRSVRPFGYTFAFPSFFTPVAFLGALIAQDTIGWGLCVCALAARMILHVLVQPPGNHWLLQLALIPLREFLNLTLWTAGFLTRRVHWRDTSYFINSDGSVLQSVRARS
jgi:ceramide glucosyltransferase